MQTSWESTQSSSGPKFPTWYTMQESGTTAVVVSCKAWKISEQERLRWNTRKNTWWCFGFHMISLYYRGYVSYVLDFKITNMGMGQNPGT